ncbi:MAG: tetrahydromethanopterin:alpha-L-glutamate ligase [Methanosarcinaceae archaeon]|nr:tetrahydromethanopterin:alpha-L-glutamate ligase [Methanosarcinaceae archaeon]
MKNIGIVVTDPEDWTAKALFKVAKEENLSPLFIDLRAAEVSIAPDPLTEVGGTCLSELDAVLVRDVGAGTLEGVSFRFDILRELETEGIPVVNSPAAIQNAANKYHASYLLAKAGLPAPKTRAVQSVGAGLRAISEFKDAIIKPVFGYKGKGIVRVKEGEVLFSERNAGTVSVSLEETLESLLGAGGMLYIQEFIENPGRDIRVFVVNGRAIGAIYRRAPPGAWINNLSQGGTADRCVLSEDEKTIAEKAAIALGADFAGVDLIEGREGEVGRVGEEGRVGEVGRVGREEKTLPKILEVNGTPSGKGIYDTWKINPAEEIIGYVKEKL